MSELLRDRSFKVWDYCISFSQLLIRSRGDPDDGTTVDLIFRGVIHFEGPFGLGEIELQEPSEDDLARIGSSAEDRCVWALQGTRGRCLIAANNVSIEQNRDGLMASPFRQSATPEPPDLIEFSIEPVDPSERPALLESLASPDAQAVLKHVVDKLSGRVLLRGRSVFDTDAWFTTREKRIALRVGPPRVLYRETFAHPVTIDETHKTRAIDGAAFARVLLTFEPQLCGTGASFASRVEGGAVPDAYLGGIAEGVWAALAQGPHGMPVVDVAVVLHDGAYHEEDSSPDAFAAAARAAGRRALREAGTRLLEPMMRVEVTVPADYSGAVRGDFVARRGRMLDQGWSGESITLVARVPLANMLGYRHQLRSLTQGRGYYEMRFDCWEPVDPPEPPSRFRPAMALRAVSFSAHPDEIDPA